MYATRCLRHFLLALSLMNSFGSYARHSHLQSGDRTVIGQDERIRVLFKKVLNWGKEEAEKLLRIRSFEDPILKWKGKVKFNDDFSFGNHLGLVIKKLPILWKVSTFIESNLRPVNQH